MTGPRTPGAQHTLTENYARNCRFGERCNFAHGEHELRRLPPRSGMIRGYTRADGPLGAGGPPGGAYFGAGSGTYGGGGGRAGGGPYNGGFGGGQLSGGYGGNQGQYGGPMGGAGAGAGGMGYGAGLGGVGGGGGGGYGMAQQQQQQPQHAGDQWGGGGGSYADPVRMPHIMHTSTCGDHHVLRTEGHC